jgi:protein tyrosine phosphatase (PTP) superfamily phosphohydrolase (DUF442 family)
LLADNPVDGFMTPPPTFRGILVLVVATLACGAGGGCVSSESHVRNVHTVVPGTLVRGGQPDARGFRALRDSYGLAAVVNLNDATCESEAAVVTGLGMSYVALPSDARRPEATKVLAFLRAVEQFAEKGAVYVHCRHGMDRTGLAVAAYRVAVEGWDANRAVRELRAHQAFPHELMFPRLPSFVHKIYRERDGWRRRLAENDEAIVAADAAAPAF